MPDEKGELREINYRQLMPWTELFRAFSIAGDPRKLLLAAAGIFVMSAGWWLLAQVFISGPEPQKSAFTDNLNNYRDGEESDESARTKALKDYDAQHGKWELLDRTTRHYRHAPWGIDRGPNPYRVVTGDANIGSPSDFVLQQVGVLLEPLNEFIQPVFRLINPNAGVFFWLFSILGIIWTLATWAVFGGAITRMASVQFARKEKIGLVDAVKFAWSKFLSFFCAPLIPFLFIAGITLIMIIGGYLLTFIPVLGDVLGGGLWPLAIAGGFLMALLLFGLVGWPMMYAAISAEGGDSFSALSNSYSYIYQRPWNFLLYSVVALIYGVMVIFFVVLFTSLFVYMSKWAVGVGNFAQFRAGGDPISPLFVYAPTSYDWRALLTGTDNVEALEALKDTMSGFQKVGAGLAAFWLGLVFLMMIGFAYSYFWTASTIIYFLLRKNVDDTELDEVYLEEEEEEAYSMPAMPTNPTTATAGVSSTLPMAEANPTNPPPSPPIS